jgi:hypothetical protein
MLYTTSVCLFPIYKPHHSLLAIINIPVYPPVGIRQWCRVSKTISATPYCMRTLLWEILEILRYFRPAWIRLWKPFMSVSGQWHRPDYTIPNLPVIEDHRLLFFVPGETFGSFTDTHLFYTIIWTFWNLTDIVQVFHTIEIMWIPGFRVCETEGPDNLRNGKGKKQMLSINFIWSNDINKIFSPLIISSGRLFNNIALFKGSAGRTPLNYLQWRLSGYTRGVIHEDSLSCHQLDPPRMNVSSFRTVYSPDRYRQSSHNGNKTVLYKPNSGRVV